MRTPIVVPYIFAACILVGCSDLIGFSSDEAQTETYAYTAYDSTATAVLKGRLHVTFEKVDEGSGFQLDGAWDLRQIRETKRPIGKQTGEGKLQGTVGKNAQVHIDLCPNLVDASVTLRGEFQGKRRRRMEGDWSYRSWVPINGGTFQAETKQKPPRTH